MQKQNSSFNIFKFTLLVFVLQIAIIRVSSNECGTVEVLVPRILGGRATQRGEWPFLTALHYSKMMQFFCGGTLLSTKHVLTAAHCVNEKHSRAKLVADDIVVLLGAYNLSAKVERGVVQREVNEIHVHPDWNLYSDNYDADIAMLVLNEIVTFTRYIRPICLPANDITSDGTMGSIVGWGLADNGTQAHLQFPKHANVNVLNASYCLTTDPFIALLSSTRTFCGNGGDGSPNQGDSGGGFFVLSGSSWVQYGIISTLRITATGIINTNPFAVYTNVKLFRSWIDEIASKSGDVVTTVSEIVKISLECEYQENAVGYTCFLYSLDIQNENFEVTSFTGSHENGRTDLDVEGVVFRNGTMLFLPDGIGRIFKNLKRLSIVDNLNFTHSKRSNLKNMQNLDEFNIYRNTLDTLDEDTLWDLPNLKQFRLSQNNVRVLHERTFEKNTKLTEVYIGENEIETLDEQTLWTLPNLEKFSFLSNKLKILHQKTFEKNTKLKEVYVGDNDLDTLDEQTLWALPNLERFDLYHNKLKILNQRTFERNSKLRDLSVINNEIEALNEKTLWNLLNLEECRFHNNKIKILHERTFEKNTKLKAIDFSYNDIETLYEKTLWALTNLQNFLLEVNKLKVLEERTFEKNVKLTTVWLNGNRLEFLPRNLFKFNSLLEEADFTENSLKIIQADFSELNNIRHVSVYGSICINAIYDIDESFSNQFTYKINHYANLTDFQSLIRLSCSAHN